MIKQLHHIITNLKRYQWVYAAVFLVLISSCSIKGGIKNLLHTTSVETSLASGVNSGKSGYTFGNISMENCSKYQELDAKIVKSQQLDLQDFLPVLLFSAALFGMLFLFYIAKEQNHPKYSDTRKRGYRIPLFLQYQKIIIYA
ncbi:hypothetical protein ACYSNX_00990 [Myroides sp. LJL115]